MSPIPLLSDLQSTLHDATKRIQVPLLLYGIVESILVILLILMWRSNTPLELVRLGYVLLSIVFVIAMIHFCLEVIRLRSTININPPSSSIPGVFAKSDSPAFATTIEELAKTASRVVMAGIGINMLQRQPLCVTLMQRAQAGGCNLQVYLANPFGHGVETRLIEEELGDLRPPVGKAGLIRQLGTLLECADRYGASRNISLKTFRHYPTIAFMILDDDYFLYPYGHAMIGNFSPVLHFSRKEEMFSPFVAFVEDHLRRLETSSSDAKAVYNYWKGKKPKLAELHEFALYLIPSQGSKLYEFGSEVLGYDVLNHSYPQSPWQQYVGEAKNYGFHITLCDVLYFDNMEELRTAITELHFLAQEFHAIDLSNLSIQTETPDRNQIGITCDDTTGALEAMHHEVVHRVYSRSVASNYTLGLTNRSSVGSPSRTELFTRRYMSPSILKKFHPHLTLLGNIDPLEQPQIQESLIADFEKRGCEPRISLDNLYVMSRRDGSDDWSVKEIIPLSTS